LVHNALILSTFYLDPLKLLPQRSVTQRYAWLFASLFLCWSQCNHLYGHKRTWSVFCDRRSHRVWAPEYNDTQDRDYSHSFQNPGTERERRQESLRKDGRIIFELTCNRLPDHKRILWADQSHLVPLLPNICIHYRPFLRIIHNPESDQTLSRKWYPTKSHHTRLFELILNVIAIVPYF